MISTFIALMAATSLTGPDIKACAVISDDTARLECFDLAVKEMKAPRRRMGRRVRAEAPVRTAEAAAASDITARQPEERFGLIERVENEVAQIESAVDKITITSRGVATVYLSNGQIWRQLSSDDTRVLKTRINNPQNAIVKTRRFGGYRLILSPMRKAILVRRVDEG